MNVNLGIWDKLTRLIVFLMLVAAILGVVLWYKPVIEENERLRQTRFELEKKIAREQETAKKLDASFRALQDPKTVERLARERLSYAKPGETVIRFEAPVTNAVSVVH